MMRISLAAGGLFLIASVLIADDPAETVAVNKPAPDFTVKGRDGKQFKLSDKTGSGKNVALMFSRAHW